MPLVVAAIIGAGAAFGGAAISSKAANKAGDTQAKASEDAAKLQSDASAQALAFEQDQAAKARADNIAAQQANFGQWGYRQNSIRPLQASGLQANNTLSQLLGLPAQNTQLPDLPSAPNFSSGGPSTPTSNPNSGASGYLKSLLDNGMDPQKASDQTNAKFPGAAALYYPPSDKTSGKAVIGLPGSYLSQEDNGWNITPRGNEGGSAAATNRPVSIRPPTPLGPGQNLSFVPGSLGSIAMA